MTTMDWHAHLLSGGDNVARLPEESRKTTESNAPVICFDTVLVVLWGYGLLSRVHGPSHASVPVIIELLISVWDTVVGGAVSWSVVATAVSFPSVSLSVFPSCVLHPCPTTTQTHVTTSTPHRGAASC